MLAFFVHVFIHFDPMHSSIHYIGMKNVKTVRMIQWNNTKSLQAYLDKEKIVYEIYQEERVFKRVLETSNQKKKTGKVNLI